jgi:hypothetical protein
MASLPGFKSGDPLPHMLVRMSIIRINPVAVIDVPELARRVPTIRSVRGADESPGKIV